MTLVRAMSLRDLDRIMDIEVATYTQPWTRGIFTDELAAESRTYVVAEHEGQILGYGGLMQVDEDAHVTTLVSVAAAPVKAVGTRLMLALIASGLGAGARQLTFGGESLESSSSGFLSQVRPGAGRCPQGLLPG